MKTYYGYRVKSAWCIGFDKPECKYIEIKAETSDVAWCIMFEHIINGEV